MRNQEIWGAIMKNEIVRLTKSWIFWFLVALQIVIIMLYSINYVNDSKISKDRWYHEIGEYNNTDLSIDDQIDNLRLQIESFKQLEKNKSVIEMITYYEETIEILEYLRDNNYSYDEIQESEVMYYHEEDKRAFTLQTLEVLMWLNIIVSIVLLCVLVNMGKTNGAFTFKMLLNGRKTVFFTETKMYIVLMIGFFCYQIALLTGLSMQLPKKSKYLLHYNAGNIIVRSETLECFLAIVSLAISLLVVYILHFIMSQIINNVFAFFIISISVTIAIKLLLVKLSSYSFFRAFNVSLNNIYENDVSIGLYMGVTLFRILIAIALLMCTYVYCMKRKISVHNN